MSKDKIYMCSDCDTLFDTSEEALECCQCENCAALKKQLDAYCKASVMKVDYDKLKKQLEAVRPYVQHKRDSDIEAVHYAYEPECNCGLAALQGENHE
jgi:hypothetical protein